MTARAAITYLRPASHWWATMWATQRGQFLATLTYPIYLIRAPIDGILFFLTMWVTYQISGQAEVAGASAAGFLIIGLIGLEAWGSSVWSSGYAIQWERQQGTIGSLFLSPASRIAVIVGYGISGFVWSALPLAMLIGLGLLVGARFTIADPLAVLCSLAAVYGGALAVGFALAGVFVLSRRGNVLANALQFPMWLLAGFLVPRDALPEWLQTASNVLPAAHSTDALRASTLTGATLAGVWPSLAAAIVTSLGFVILGAFGLSRVEHAARRAGSLELY